MNELTVSSVENELRRAVLSTLNSFTDLQSPEHDGNPVYRALRDLIIDLESPRSITELRSNLKNVQNVYALLGAFTELGIQTEVLQFWLNELIGWNDLFGSNQHALLKADAKKSLNALSISHWRKLVRTQIIKRPRQPLR